MMRIGLVRHFKVNKAYPMGKRISGKEVMKWFEEYDVATIEDGSTDLGGIEWNECFSSDLSRAVLTAEKIYEGTVYQKIELKEISVPKFNLDLKLPFICWAICIQISWFINRQTRLDIKNAEGRIRNFIDEIIYKKRIDPKKIPGA